MKIYKIVLTGGPCAGKTTIFNYVLEKLKNEGYYVISVPETARECIFNGIIPNKDINHTLMFQDVILNTQKNKEENAEKYANSIINNSEIINGKKGIIILYDRGIMDNRAYLSLENYEKLLRKYNYKEINLLDKFDLVIDLISTATMNKDLYVMDNERKESVEDAEHEDLLTSNGWILHHNLRVVKPTENLLDKAEIVLNYIYDLLLDNQKRKMVSLPIDKNMSDLSVYNDDNSKRIKITNIYLTKNQEFNYVVSKREYKGNISLVSKLEKISNNITFIKDNRQISYEKFVEEIDLYGINDIRKHNVLSFIDNGNFYNLIENEENLFLETNPRNAIPNNLVLKEKSKKLVKYD